jgi:hypothetical protein
VLGLPCYAHSHSPIQRFSAPCRLEEPHVCPTKSCRPPVHTSVLDTSWNHSLQCPVRWHALCGGRRCRARCWQCVVHNLLQHCLTWCRPRGLGHYVLRLFFLVLILPQLHQSSISGSPPPTHPLPPPPPTHTHATRSEVSLKRSCVLFAHDIPNV